MTIEQYVDFCLSLPGVEESFPFDDKTLVFKVGGKMFALTNIDSFDFINLKCNPDKALELRAQYPEDILPGYHMNKKHWNSVSTNGNINDEMLHSLIRHSYQLVYDKLPKRVKQTIAK
ncbi:MAG TPA: MmcQ-like protein [Flavobacteriales bacterium]|nr:MmcQ-like protein [Flavobacteriales bacterium]|tara:strand:+ start:35569 stop:35922 length:354 start_codon:yes stop_codon:yes gene_type:complete